MVTYKKRLEQERRQLRLEERCICGAKVVAEVAGLRPRHLRDRLHQEQVGEVFIRISPHS